MSIPYTAPAVKVTSFNCPHCHAFAAQGWGAPHIFVGPHDQGTNAKFLASTCTHCKGLALWWDGGLVFPPILSAPFPNPDMSADVARDFEEARGIVGRSPRGAAALLRLAIQKVCKELGESGKNVNADIGALVKRGLPVQVQQALDIVRVVGNNAVHPGQIDLRDDQATALQLFNLVNLIVDILVSQPKHVSKIYEQIVPPEQRGAIAARDGQSAGEA